MSVSRPLSFLKQAGGALATLLFPHKCLVCSTYLDSGQTGSDSFGRWVCTACLSKGLPRFGAPFCTCCGKAFPIGEAHLCESCVAAPPPIHMTRAVFIYQDLVRTLLPLFKYNGKTGLAALFSPMMFEALETWFGDPLPDLILPIPLHPKKLRQRGFNQSWLLVREFKKLHRQNYGVPPSWSLDIRSLDRVRHTHPQTGYDVKVRQQNLKGAFQVKGRSAIKGKHILLVDDVFTTGTTCNEAARELLASGAEQVDALILARA